MFISNVTELLLFFIFVGGLCVANEEDAVQIQEYPVDEGGSLTLLCTDPESKEDGDKHNPPSVYWTHKGRTMDSIVQDNNSLFLQQVKREDSGLYKCTSSDTDQVLRQMKVIVRTAPPRLVNVTVHPSTILALLRWDVEDTGGYPLTHITVQYRLKHSYPDQPPDEWHRIIPGRISPTASQVDVYKLKPNSSYIFEVWASNELGEGEIVQVEATTNHNSEEIELGRHLLEGVENFDTRYWVAAVAVVMGTLVVLALGTCYVLYRECHLPLNEYHVEHSHSIRSNKTPRTNKNQNTNGVLSKTKLIQQLPKLNIFSKSNGLLNSVILQMDNTEIDKTKSKKSYKRIKYILNDMISELKVMVDDHEIMELVPNIILNPGYDNSDPRMDWIDPDENANDYRTTQLNNNSIIRPFRV